MNTSKNSIQTLYNYCSTSTFQILISRASLRLSALSHSNDSLEGKVFDYAIEQAINRSDLDPVHKQDMLNVVPSHDGVLDGLGMCFSEEGDLLSQWRGYADDAQGFSVGFSRAFLDQIRGPGGSNLNVKLIQIGYDYQEHVNFVERELGSYFEIARSGALTNHWGNGAAALFSGALSKPECQEWMKLVGRVRDEIRSIAIEHAFRMKAPAFSEEREWRLLHCGPTWSVQGIDAYARTRKLVPFVALNIEDRKDAIKEVLIGPKNETPIDIVVKFLTKHGFGSFSVRRSRASYR